MNDDRYTPIINNLWRQYAQQITYQVPGGLGGELNLKMPVGLMAESAFKAACRVLLSFVNDDH